MLTGGLMSVLVSDELLQAANMFDTKIKTELAILLYQQKKLSLSKAREFAGIALVEFQQELDRRQIPVFDDLASLETEISQLQTLGDL
jgi:predicted HTH domain antitoxin